MKDDQIYERHAMVFKGQEFAIGNKVKILELNRNGRIVDVWLTASGIKYNVRYFDNAKAETVYFYKDEIKKIQENEARL